MDISRFNVNEKQVAEVSLEKTFYVGDAIEVVVNLYKNDGKYYLTSWLNGCEECHTVEYTGSMNESDITEAMKQLVYDNEDYIISLATPDEEEDFDEWYEHLDDIEREEYNKLFEENAD